MKTSIYIFIFTFLTGMALGQKVIVKDTTGNILMEVNDEGNAGSISIPSAVAPSITTSKLYNVGNELFWHGNKLGTDSVAGGWVVNGLNIYPVNTNSVVGIGTTTPGATLDVRGDAVFNDDSDDKDFRVESNFNANMLFVDGGTDRVGIGTNIPQATLDVRGDAVFNNGNLDRNFRVNSALNQFMLFVDGGTSQVGIGTSVPSATLDVEGYLQIDGTTFNVDAGNNRVGIGTTAPSASLDVRGDAVFNDDGLDKNFRVESIINGNMLFVDGGTSRVGIGTNTPSATFDVRGSAVFNEDGLDRDLRVESNLNGNMLFVDGGTNRVGIGTNIPQATLDVAGDAEIFGRFTVDGPTFNVDPGFNRVGIGTYNPAATLDVRGNAVFNDDGLDNNFRVESNINANMLFVDASTDRVGIGTNAPSATLDVRGDAVFNNNGLDRDFRVESDINPNQLFVDGSTSRVGIGTNTPEANLDVRGDAVFNNNGNNNDFRVESLTNTNMLFVDASTDRVGIGTNIPAADLDVRGDAVFNNDGLDKNFRIESNNNSNMFFIDGGTNKVGIATNTPAEILEVNGNVFASGGDFYTANSSGVINCGGGFMSSSVNIIADATPTPTNVDGDEDLYIQDDLELGSQGYKPGGGNWAAISDVRMKREIAPFQDGLHKLLQINPVRYKYNDAMHLEDPDRMYVGIIAQDILSFAPYMVEEKNLFQKVHEDENGNEIVDEPGTPYYTYDGTAMTYIIINAIKEQQVMIENLQGTGSTDTRDVELEQLRRENREIKIELDALRTLVKKLLKEQ